MANVWHYVLFCMVQRSVFSQFGASGDVFTHSPVLDRDYDVITFKQWFLSDISSNNSPVLIPCSNTVTTPQPFERINVANSSYMKALHYTNTGFFHCSKSSLTLPRPHQTQGLLHIVHWKQKTSHSVFAVLPTLQTLAIVGKPMHPQCPQVWYGIPGPSSLKTICIFI